MAEGTSALTVLICTHDDRPRARSGLKALVLSLAEHCPDTQILVSWPTADADFTTWLNAQANVIVHVDPALVGHEWNIKPGLLLHCLDQGHESVLWLDSDIIIARDFRPRLAEIDPRALIVAEDFYWASYVFPGGTVRARLWGLHAGKDLPFTANSGIVRVTQDHRPLLHAWQALLRADPYQGAHTREWTGRPIHMVGDQDVLTALLSCQRFAQLDVAFLRRRSDIIYNFGPSGYTAGERLLNLTSPLPPFIHCTGPKPWEAPANAAPWRNLTAYYRRIGLELAEYNAVARRYRNHFDPDDLALDIETLPAKVCRALALGNPHLSGLPLALFHGMGRRLRKALGHNAWPHVEANLRAGERPDGERILDADCRALRS